MLNGPPRLVLTDIGLALAAAATAYAALSTAVVLGWRRRLREAQAHRVARRAAAHEGPRRQAASGAARVTVLKPLAGAEPHLYEALRSFCDQSAGGFQIVFGVRDAGDPAVAVVRRLQREFRQLDLDLAVDATLHGTSLKVSNLINMMRLAHHDLLVIADSDVEVGPDYLARVVAPLADPTVGIVTCPYLGRAGTGPWSQLLASFINDWFLPSVLVAAFLGSRAFAFGATIALRRDTLEAIGGFEAIADQLADDYRLGELTREAGLRTVLSHVVVETRVEEPTARALIRHELRWLRTIRTVRPGGYAFSCVTFTLPIAALGWGVSGGTHVALGLLAITGGARLLLHFAVRAGGTASWQLWVLPFNDLLAILLWAWAFVSRSVHWRQTRYSVGRDGSARPLV